MQPVYVPAEDSTLLARHVINHVSGFVLDMGTGSGIIAVSAASKTSVDRVIAVDINPSAIEKARKKSLLAGVKSKIDFVIGDLLEMMRGEIFDWIAFNPPYLPSEGKIYDPSWIGGEKGREIIWRFLLEAAEHLREDGSIIVIISSNTGIEFEKIEEYYNVELLEEYPLFFEKLYCLLLSPSVTQDKSHL